MTMLPTDDEKKQIQKIYEGESSAVETYEQALQKMGTDPQADQLLRMQNDHIQAVNTLGRYLKVTGSEKPTSSGAWGTWAKTVMGVSTIIGNKAALKALKEGEEHGLKQYNEAAEAIPDPTIQAEIRGTFIPQQQKHIAILDGLLDAT